MSVIDEVQALQAATLAEIDQAATSDALEAIRIIALYLSLIHI